MYNAHRGMMTHGAPSNRLTELLEQIRVEFDGQATGRAGDFEQQREALSKLFHMHINQPCGLS